MNYLSIAKWILVALIIVGAFTFVHMALGWKADSERGAENFRQSTLVDSLKVANYILTSGQIQQKIDGTPDLKKFIEDQNIKTSRIETLVMQSLLYRDNSSRSTNVSEAIQAIKQGQKVTIPFKDSTSCLKIRGEMVYLPNPTGDTLLINIKDRQFNNDYTAVGYLKRRQWNFLGIKTRFLGKLEATATVKNTCGDTKTINIEKKKD